MSSRAFSPGREYPDSWWSQPYKLSWGGLGISHNGDPRQLPWLFSEDLQIKAGTVPAQGAGIPYVQQFKSRLLHFQSISSNMLGKASEDDPSAWDPDEAPSFGLA